MDAHRGRLQNEFGREEKRHIWGALAGIAGGVLGAAGSIGGGLLSSQGAKAAGRAGRGSVHKFPLPPYQRAFERYYTRLLAENLLGIPPSFADYISSGGTATFPIKDTGFSPGEAQQLGLVGPRGQDVPFVSRDQSQLTPEQQLYLGYLRGMHQKPGEYGPLARASRINEKVGRLLDAGETNQKLLDRLRARRDRLLNRGSSGEVR